MVQMKELGQVVALFCADGRISVLQLSTGETSSRGERALFQESHRNCFAWIDEWYGKTMTQIRELERYSDSSLNQKLGKTSVDTEEDVQKIRSKFEIQDSYITDDIPEVEFQ